MMKPSWLWTPLIFGQFLRSKSCHQIELAAPRYLVNLSWMFYICLNLISGSFISGQERLLYQRLRGPWHHSQWHKSMDTHFIETWYKNKSHVKFCLLIVASDPKWQKKEIKGRRKGGIASHPRCLELQWWSLSSSEPFPRCCRGAMVFQSPMSGVIHVLANMCWWGFRTGREERLHTRVGER